MFLPLLILFALLVPSKSARFTLTAAPSLSQPKYEVLLTTSKSLPNGSISLNLPFPLLVNGQISHRLTVLNNSTILFPLFDQNSVSASQASLIIAFGKNVALKQFTASSASGALKILCEGYDHEEFSDDSRMLTWELTIYQSDSRAVFDLVAHRNDGGRFIPLRICDTYQNCPVMTHLSVKAPIRIQECGTGCSECSLDGLCQNCQPGFFLSASGKCQRCPSSCGSCVLASSGIVSCDRSQKDQYPKGNVQRLRKNTPSSHYALSLFPQATTTVLSLLSLLLSILAVVLILSRSLKLKKTVELEKSQNKETFFIPNTKVEDIGFSSYKISYQTPETPTELNEYYCSDVSCSVCLDKQGLDIMSSCRHFFHSDCVLNWYAKKGECPICRTKDISFVAICRDCGNSRAGYDPCVGKITGECEVSGRSFRRGVARLGKCVECSRRT